MSESRGLEIPFCHEVKCSEERGEGGRGRRERRGGGRRGHITRGVQVSIPKMCFLIERCPTHVHQLIHIQAHMHINVHVYLHVDYLIGCRSNMGGCVSANSTAVIPTAHISH